ncbi:hypothetical protein [Microbacterium paludicola]|uniref:phage major capsid protein n=1 Tax=Microbacterium paludicola TaxID=300019 RepID=UPI00119EBF01|nr:hypothetical protein [Microbacterium paludicola]
MTDILTYGDFAYDPDARTLRGLLLPFGEKCRTSTSGHEVEFSADTIDLPRDPSVVTLNREHNRHDPIGRATALAKTDRGVEATFQLGNTDEADDWLSRQKDTLRKLSAEVVFAADKVRAKLTGSALVTEGAFASAGLFALAETPADEAKETPDEDTPSEEPEAAEAAESEDAMTDIATLPEGVQPAGDSKADTTASGLFASISRVGRGDAAEARRLAGENADFAIAGIQHSGPSSVTIGADTQETGYLGELWSGNAYRRKYVNLFHQRALTNYEVRGWKWVSKPEVAAYAGNLAEVPSNAVDTAPVTATARRIAGGHRIDRRYLDFNDQGVIESYFRLMSESYAKVSDADILAKAVAAAGSATDIDEVDGVNGVYAGIIQGALDLVAEDITPTFAVVDPSVYASVLYELDKEKLAHLSNSFGLTGGTFDGFTVVPGAVGTDNVLVGARQALTVFELPGVPIRVDALAVHNGALDTALYGYLGDITNDARGLSLKHTTPAAG